MWIKMERRGAQMLACNTKSEMQKLSVVEMWLQQSLQRIESAAGGSFSHNRWLLFVLFYSKDTKSLLS